MKKKSALLVVSMGIFLFTLAGSRAFAAGEQALVVAQAEQPAASTSESGHGMSGMQGMEGEKGGKGMMGSDMMGGCMGMMNQDPKTRGQMMQIRGRMMKEMGELLEKRGKEMEQGK